MLEKSSIGIGESSSAFIVVERSIMKIIKISTPFLWKTFLIYPGLDWGSYAGLSESTILPTAPHYATMLWLRIVLSSNTAFVPPPSVLGVDAPT